MERLAFLGDNKQVNLWQNNKSKQITYPLQEGETTPALWPTWSPDGQWIAYFQPLTDRSPARLCVTQASGMDMMVLAEMQDRQPIYIHWSPLGTHIAVVEQSPEGLELVVYPLNGSRAIPLDDGAPIFFQWTPDGTGIVAHIVHPVRQTSRIQYYSLEDSNTDWVITEHSGGFYTPLFLNGRLLYAEQFDGLTHIKQMDLNTEQTDTLFALEGMLSLHPRPNHSQIAIGVSGPQPQLPKGIHLFDLNTGEQQRITEDNQKNLSWQSMFWSPNGEKLLLSAVNGQQRWLEWQMWSEGEGHQVIHSFVPTREQLFYLHFFDQFTLSHPILSSDNQHFYFSGYEAPTQRQDTLPRPWIFRGEMKMGGSFEALEHGLFPTRQPSSL